MVDIVDPFSKSPIEKLFEASANIEYVGRIAKSTSNQKKEHTSTEYESTLYLRL